MPQGEIHFIEVDEEEFAEECINIVRKAEEKGITLRILGALAVYVHTRDDERCKEIHKLRFGESTPAFTDLDLIAYSKQYSQVKKFFEDEGFMPDRMVNILFGKRRLIYYHPQGKYHIDIFFDKLEFSHDVPFGGEPGEGRLDLSSPAITPTDIVLEKLQIHEINRKDLVDLVVIFLSHELSGRDGEKLVNMKYIAKLLADDWGFWYDAKVNLKKLEEFTESLRQEGVLTDQEANTVIAKTRALARALDDEPKTKKWKKRAKKGTSKKWYRDVEELVR